MRHVRGNERMQGTQCGLEEPCTVEVVCTVRWGGERSDALSLPDKRQFVRLSFYASGDMMRPAHNKPS